MENTNFKELILSKPEDIKRSLQTVKLLKSNIKKFIEFYDIQKSEIIENFDFSNSKYYRLIKDGESWDTDDLIKLVDLIIKKL